MKNRNTTWFITGLLFGGIVVYIVIYTILFMFANSNSTRSNNLPSNDLKSCWNQKYTSSLDRKDITPVKDNKKYSSNYIFQFDAGSCIAANFESVKDKNINVTKLNSNYSTNKFPTKFRCLPSFIIAGAMKSGTGELMKWLRFHPKLRVGKGTNNRREIHFFTPLTYNAEYFDQFYNKSEKYLSEISKYANHFPLFTSSEAESLYTFEKSPDYIRNPAVLHGIRTLLPNMKIVILLRNPVHRAISEFNHQCKHKRYIRLLKNVVLNGVMHPRGSILRIFSSQASNNDNASINSNVVERDKRVVATKYAVTEDTNNSNYHQPPSSSISLLSAFPHSLTLQSLPPHSYAILNHPCSATDMETYFRGMKTGSGRSTVNSSSSSNNNDDLAMENLRNHSPILEISEEREVPLPSSSSSSSRLLLSHAHHGKNNQNLRRKTDLSNTTNNVIDQSNSSSGYNNSISNSSTNSNYSSNDTNYYITTRQHTYYVNDSAHNNKNNSKYLHIQQLSSRTGQHQQQHHQYVIPEIINGFYDKQVTDLLNIFPSSQVLILLQEDMYRQTFSTLRDVEAFLQLPCFNYATMALPSSLSPSSSVTVTNQSSIDSSDSAKQKQQQKNHHQQQQRTVPPKRVPVTVNEKFKHYRKQAGKYLSSWMANNNDDHIHSSSSDTEKLLETASSSLLLWLEEDIYRSRNRKLSELLYNLHNNSAFSLEHLQLMGWNI